MSILASALVLIWGDENFDALPTVRDDDLWREIKDVCGLNIFQLSALKNARCVGKCSINAILLIIFNIHFDLE